MIKAQDLRVGNLLKLKEHNGVFKVLEIQQDTINIVSNNSIQRVCYLRRMEPIPLTPEWLERAGFEPNYVEDIGNGYWSHKQESFELRNYGTYYIYCVNIGEYDIGDKQIKYVHEVQNLFYALIGKELEFNLDNLN